MRQIALVITSLLALALTACSTRDGLIPAMADGSLAGCVEWAQKNGDAEIEALCRAGRPLTEILDLFAARQRKSVSRDAGAE